MGNYHRWTVKELNKLASKPPGKKWKDWITENDLWVGKYKAIIHRAVRYREERRRDAETTADYFNN